MEIQDFGSIPEPEEGMEVCLAFVLGEAMTPEQIEAIREDGQSLGVTGDVVQGVCDLLSTQTFTRGIAYDAEGTCRPILIGVVPDAIKEEIAKRDAKPSKQARFVPYGPEQAN